jgi:hypothetical protein
MKRQLPILLGGALAVVLGAAADARANFVPWTYNWSPGSAFLSSTTGSGRLYTSNEPLGTVDGSSNIVVTDLRTASTAPRDHPDVFTNVAFTASLTIVDKLNNLTGTASFSGVFNGTISSGSAQLEFKLTSPQKVDVQLGKDLFAITFGRYSPPGPPSAQNTGSIASFVKVTDPPPQNSPEPSAALLACVGGAGLGFASWRRRLRARAQAA